MLFLVMIVLSATFIQNGAGYEVSQAGARLRTKSAQTDDVSRLILGLESESLVVQKRSRARLIRLGQTSRGARRRVVERLIAVIDAPNVRYEIARSGEKYRAFAAAAEILAELRATEALDQLIRCLDCNNLVHGESGSRYPVTLAVKRFGDVAVPQLRRALLNFEVGVRVQAARTLGMIGVPNALEALQSALRVEKDDDIQREIQSELNYLVRKSH